MSNSSIKVNLLQLQGAFVTNLKGKTATKRCLVIPVDDANLYVGQKGCYLNMTAIEMQNSQYGDTHFIKQNLEKSVYDAMTEEQRRAMPIIGSMRPLEKSQAALDTTYMVETNDDLPF